MNEASVAEQQQIFDAPMEQAEREAVNALVTKHKANAALTQQLALDASRLVTTSQERLARQAEAGFFKRLASAISGKTNENQALNQLDMLKIQRFAWHYLQQLQQQNLINAQAIAVIRNNLGTMNDYIIETRDFLEHAVDRLHHRLQHVENNTGFNTWALNVEANKRRFKSIPKNLLILRLTYDFMRRNPQVNLTGDDVDNYLVTTLEKLHVNCDEEIRLLDFVSELIDQIDVVGIAQYRAAIELSFDDHTIDSDFIQKNVSGIGFNSLYFLSDHYDKIVDLIGDESLCNSDEAREKIISKFFGRELSGLSTVYGIRALIHEMVGGSQVAIDIYKDVHGLNVVEEAVEEIPASSASEAVALVSSLSDIKAHTGLDSSSSAEWKRQYLVLLALCVENSVSLNAMSREFISLLTERADLPDLQPEMLQVADQPRKHSEYQSTLLATLDTEDKKYTWLIDAFYLLTLAGRPVESPSVKVLLGVLKPAQLKECLPAMLTLVNGDDESEVLAAAKTLSALTRGWRNILQYRTLRFDSYFAEPVKRLDAVSWRVTQQLLEMSSVYAKGMEHSVFFNFSDGSFVSNLTDKASAKVCSMGRSSALSGLNEHRKKARALITENRSALSQANSVISQWGMPDFECKDDIAYSDYELDNSAENEDWGDQFGRYYHQVEGVLEAFSRACSDASDQIGFFMGGDFDKSVVKIREQKQADRLRREQLEKLEKQSVTLTKDGREHLFTIEWTKVENPPCDPDKINHVKTDGKIWLIVASVDSNDVFYRSEDGVHWQEVLLDTPDFKVWFESISIVNGTWLIRNRASSRGTRSEGVYYSSDALEWRHRLGPVPANNSSLSLNDGHLSTKEIIYFNGMWLWICTQYERYSYIEKGFFSDSTKTGSYARTIVFCAKTLDGPWQRWDKSPTPDEGVKIETISALPGRNALLAFCEYDYSYLRDKKKPEMPPFVMYYGAAKTWQKCNWGGSTNFGHYRTPPAFADGGDELVYIGSEILSSEKGYDWQLRDSSLSFKGYFPLKDVSLFTPDNSGSAIHVSQDLREFKELMLDDGAWSHLTANQANILGVYYANRHEETMLRIGNYITQEKS
ncbi:hypothetical protein SAMN04488595_11871 [Ralstonia sp. 25mfcol4.1]|uniref:hypothetical protein n=1 Tax=Ralstonia sp. 25mfcol4.1 TaxID=1761899 RepID=UPI000408090B|nr:hypothetical protein [Ralstonia sp. 25mfcol4.1]SDP72640.1 hypothetical protein SAMN04488595_11871 [Ralstonia sp. 25mfcol4.1]